MTKGNEETQIMKDISVTLSSKYYLIYRNNVGEGRAMSGQWIQFGLCPDSSDLIGLKSIIIKPEDVGKRIGVFCAYEVKTEKGILSEGQEHFLNTIETLGGEARVLRSNKDAEELSNAEYIYIAPKRSNGGKGMGDMQPKKKRQNPRKLQNKYSDGSMG